jgi:hypothetical protein
MQKNVFVNTILAMALILISCSSPSSNSDVSVPSSTNSSESQSITEKNNVVEEKKIETNCDDDKRAYEFGREMNTMVKLGASSLRSAIDEYGDALGLEPPFDRTNPCVIKGFEDSNNNTPSPYNKEGKNWSRF